MFGLGSQEIIIILVIAIVLFGAKKLPQTGEGVGKALINFRKAASDKVDDVSAVPSQEQIAVSKSENSNSAV